MGLRAVRNESPLTQDQVDDKLRNREKYGFWNVILPYGSSGSYSREDESNWKFLGRAALYLFLGIVAVFWAMKFVEFMYGDIVAKRRREFARKQRMRRELELEQKREVEVGQLRMRREMELREMELELKRQVEVGQHGKVSAPAESGCG